MDLLNRPLALDPYEALPPVPSFSLSSEDLVDGERMGLSYAAVGDNVSPQLSWSGFPSQTQSFVLTCFDPDAPTPSGYWHWTILDIPADMTGINRGAGASDLYLDGPAFHLRNDGGEHSYMGAAPPEGDREHRYIFAVHALDVPTLGLDADTTATTAAFHCLFRTLARARLTVTYKR